MTEGHLLEFSIQCDPASMIGYVQFTILISVEKSHYCSVYEHMYMEFQENVLYHPSTIDPDDLLIFVLFGENVFMIDFILSTVDSFEGVKNVHVYILTKWQYYDDWIIREIDERLYRTVLPKSIQGNRQLDNAVSTISNCNYFSNNGPDRCPVLAGCLLPDNLVCRHIANTSS